MSSPPTPNFQTIFESAPGLYLVLTPQLVIVAVSDAYLKATMTQREQILGRGLFDVFPTTPMACAPRSSERGRSELWTRCRRKHDSGSDARYWSSSNMPVLSPDGSLTYIIHRLEDMTELTLARLRQEQLAAHHGEADRVAARRTGVGRVGGRAWSDVLFSASLEAVRSASIRPRLSASASTAARVSASLPRSPEDRD